VPRRDDIRIFDVPSDFRSPLIRDPPPNFAGAYAEPPRGLRGVTARLSCPPPPRARPHRPSVVAVWWSWRARTPFPVADHAYCRRFPKALMWRQHTHGGRRCASRAGTDRTLNDAARYFCLARRGRLPRSALTASGPLRGTAPEMREKRVTCRPGAGMIAGKSGTARGKTRTAPWNRQLRVAAAGSASHCSPPILRPLPTEAVMTDASPPPREPIEESRRLLGVLNDLRDQPAMVRQFCDDGQARSVPTARAVESAIARRSQFPNRGATRCRTLSR
jgi:hypothetical protein